MLPLSLAPVGEPAVIKRLGGSPEIKRHLEDLGFVIGGEVVPVVERDGNLIVSVKESRIAVSRELAQKIMV